MDGDTALGPPLATLDLLEQLLANSVDGVVAFDRECRYLFWNRTMEQISGMSASEVVGRRAFEVFPFLCQIGEDQFFRRALAGESAVSHERPFAVPGTGRRGFFEGHYSPLRGQDGAVVAGMAVIRDITARKLAEEQVRETESRFRSMADASPVMLWMAGTDGLCTFFNQTWLSFTGRTLEQEQGEGWAESVHPEDFKRCLGTYTEAFGARRPFQMEYRLRRADGEYRWVLDCGTARALPDGTFAGYIGSAIDITERRRLEADLQGAADQQSFLARAGASLSESLDPEATLLQVAALAVPALADGCEVLLVADGVPGRSLVRYRDALTTTRAEEAQRRWPAGPVDRHGIGRVLASGEPEIVRAVDETFWRESAQDAEHLELLRSLAIASVVYLPLVGRGRTLGALAFARLAGRAPFEGRDLATAEDLARRAASALENGIHLQQARDAIAFAGVAAHELRTPLATMLMGMQVLRKKAEQQSPTLTGEAVATGLERISRQGNRLHELVDALLDVTQISAGRLRLEPEEVDLTAVAAEVTRRLEGDFAAAGCPLVLTADAPIVGRWDRLRLEQVMTNLLSNALKYGRNQPVEVAVQGDQTRAFVTVRDHGVGIPLEDQSRIFDSFERAVPSGSFGGHGLGLWISRRIVRAHGGELRVESRPGEGALFTVELPRFATPESPH